MCRLIPSQCSGMGHWRPMGLDSCTGSARTVTHKTPNHPRSPSPLHVPAPRPRYQSPLLPVPTANLTQLDTILQPAVHHQLGKRICSSRSSRVHHLSSLLNVTLFSLHCSNTECHITCPSVMLLAQLTHTFQCKR